MEPVVPDRSVGVVGLARPYDVVSVKGRTKGNESVHARSRDKGCRDLGEFRIGTPVTVFDIIEEWAEVDIGGSHCRMLAKYITVIKETASAE